MSESITFPAQVVKVQTLADSGLRLTLDMPESEIVAFAWLAQCKRDGVALTVKCDPMPTPNRRVETSDIGTIFPDVRELGDEARAAHLQ
jgi:hypothetical protein